MREKAKEELRHIYKGDIYQNMLRNYYFNIRMASLGKKADKEKYPDDKNKILKLCIEAVNKWANKDNVDFKPQYDKTFFKTKTFDRKINMLIHKENSC